MNKNCFTKMFIRHYFIIFSTEDGFGFNLEGTVDTLLPPPDSFWLDAVIETAASRARLWCSHVQPDVDLINQSCPRLKAGGPIKQLRCQAACSGLFHSEIRLVLLIGTFNGPWKKNKLTVVIQCLLTYTLNTYYTMQDRQRHLFTFAHQPYTHIIL